MDRYFKFHALSVKKDEVSIDFEGNHNVVTSLTLLQNIDGLHATIGSVIKSIGLDETVVEAVNKMTLQKDPSIFKSMLGTYTNCNDASEWFQCLITNMPGGVLSVHMQLIFPRNKMDDIIAGFSIVPNFQKTLLTRFKDL